MGTQETCDSYLAQLTTEIEKWFKEAKQINREKRRKKKSWMTWFAGGAMIVVAFATGIVIALPVEVPIGAVAAVVVAVAAHCVHFVAVPLVITIGAFWVCSLWTRI